MKSPLTQGRGLKHIQAESIEEYNKFSDEKKNLESNRNLRKCLQEHEGHDFFIFSYDFCSIEGDHLMIYNGYNGDLLCKGFNSFQDIDLTE